MARSLGLPSRIVSGLAYSGHSFGGHAWVEVWVGRWVELDPTWGTEFVDATHIRSASSALITSASLNLIDIEVLEAKRSAAPFQATAASLAKELSKAIPHSNQATIEAAMDVSLLTDNYFGAGSWSKMSAAEREQMSRAYSRVILEIVSGYSTADKDKTGSLRILHIEEKGDKAEVLCIEDSDDILIKLELVRSNGAWYLIEVVQKDTAVRLARDLMVPFTSAIEDARAGRKIARPQQSALLRVLLAIDKNPAKAIEIADGALKTDANNQQLRFLKALALLTSDKKDEATTFLTQLSNEQPPYAPALKRLADLKTNSDIDGDTEKAIDFYRKYSQLEPYDPRPHRDFAVLLNRVDKLAEAEIELRKVVELDHEDILGYTTLVSFLVTHGQAQQAAEVFQAWEKHGNGDGDLFGLALEALYFEESEQLANFAALHPQKLKASFKGHVALANFHKQNKHFPEALRLLGAAKQLEPKSVEPYLISSEIFRAQSRWLVALKEADRAVDMDPNDAMSHYERACSLARLRRPKEALTALEKAIKLEEMYAGLLESEIDLKPLASLPGFKKLLPKE
jgi:tetratricopeptide (TPR) repeat protein